jgi:hypothetical protein
LYRYDMVPNWARTVGSFVVGLCTLNKVDP